jgi:hypothetical protein
VIAPFAGDVESCVGDRVTMMSGFISIGDVLTTFRINIFTDVGAVVLGSIGAVFGLLVGWWSPGQRAYLDQAVGGDEEVRRR